MYSIGVQWASLNFEEIGMRAIASDMTTAWLAYTGREITVVNWDRGIEFGCDVESCKKKLCLA